MPPSKRSFNVNSLTPVFFVVQKFVYEFPWFRCDPYTLGELRILFSFTFTILSKIAVPFRANSSILCLVFLDLFSCKSLKLAISLSLGLVLTIHMNLFLSNTLCSWIKFDWQKFQSNNMQFSWKWCLEKNFEHVLCPNDKLEVQTEFYGHPNRIISNQTSYESTQNFMNSFG